MPTERGAPDGAQALANGGQPSPVVAAPVEVTQSGRGLQHVAQGPLPARRAKPALRAYKRDLPHIQLPGSTLLITFATHRRWVLAPAARTAVLDCCLREHGVRLHVHGIVVMPDHVHLVAAPLADADGNWYGLAEVLQSIKGASAHAINRLMARSGRVWQPERHDHVLRRDERVRQAVDYICENPVAAGLAATPDEYPWLWREWIEGAGRRAQAGAPAPHSANDLPETIDGANG
jgi:REP element-mobilizing transposase RayT